MATRTITLQEASGMLPELVSRANRGEEVVLASDDRPVAKLVPWRAVRSQRERTFGRFRGKVHVSEDFDAPLGDDFWLASDRK